MSPLPTLPPDQAEALVLELLETNGGCQLPCWWGITPGETPWDVAKNFLESFANSSGSIRELNRQGEGKFFFGFLVPENIKRDGVLEVSILVIKGIVEDIWLNQDNVLHVFLSIYGYPSEIWIAVGTNIPGEPEYLIVLFYPTDGYWLSFADFESYVRQDGKYFVEICPNDIGPLWGTSSLYWSPGRKVEFLPAIAGHLIPEDLNKTDAGEFLPLEEATNIDVETFVSTYLDPNTEECFYSPEDLWSP